MAKRIGKYKITKRESTMSLTDGGTIDGNVVITSLSASTDPGVAGQLFVTGSNKNGSTTADTDGDLWFTGSAYIVLASAG